MTNVLTAEDQIVEVVGSCEQITVYDESEPQVVEVDSQAELVVIVEGNDNQAVDVVSPVVEFMQVDVLETGPQGRPGKDSGDLMLEESVTINRTDGEISSLEFEGGNTITINRVAGEIVSVYDGTYTKTIVRENGEITQIIVT